MNNKEHIMKFSNAFGPSGFEDDVVSYAKELTQTICHIKEDHMRNLYMDIKHSSNEGVSILLDAHSDEVGFIVQAIKPNGTLRFLPLGGWDAKNIIAGKVWIRNRLGELVSGIVCSKPVHFMNTGEREQEIGFDALVIDVGSTSAKETIEDYHIGIGAPITPAVECSYQEEHGTFIGKAFDCRIGCAALVETLHRVASPSLKNHVIATLTSQEEVGERGMSCAIHNVKPDIVICFEGCPADDTFEESYMIQIGLKRGPMLRHFDRSMITSPRFQQYALHIASTYHIRVQESVRKGGGTNGGITHTAYQGIPTIVIGIPVRFAHSPYGICAYQDYQSAISLAEHIIHDITADIVAGF